MSRIVSERKNWWGREASLKKSKYSPERKSNQSPQHNGQRSAPDRHIAVKVPTVRRRRGILQGFVARMQQERERWKTKKSQFIMTSDFPQNTGS